MARSPIYRNDTRTRWNETWLDSAKNPVDLRNADLSNATITLRIQKADGTGAHVGTGVVTPVDMSKGKFKYQVIPGDFPTDGLYTCQYVCTYSNGEVKDSNYFQIKMLPSI